MNLPELLKKHEAELTMIILKLEAGEQVDLAPMAAGWKDFLAMLKDQELTESEREAFDRIHAAFKKIEDLISEKMSELVLARTMTGG